MVIARFGSRRTVSKATQAAMNKTIRNPDVPVSKPCPKRDFMACMLMSEEMTAARQSNMAVKNIAFGGRDAFFSLNIATEYSIADSRTPKTMTTVFTKSTEI